MITYELALKLKEAGFPQAGEGGEVYNDRSRGDGTIENGFFICKPSLEELIEACGDENVVIFKERRADGDVFFAGIYYIPTSNSENVVYNDEFTLHIPWAKRKSGISSSEALANLWLELNK